MLDLLSITADPAYARRLWAPVVSGHMRPIGPLPSMAEWGTLPKRLAPYSGPENGGGPYASLEEAIDCLLRDCGFVLPSDHQADMFRV